MCGFLLLLGYNKQKKKKKEAARVHIKHLKDKKIIEIKSDSYGVVCALHQLQKYSLLAYTTHIQHRKYIKKFIYMFLLVY